MNPFPHPLKRITSRSLVLLLSLLMFGCFPKREVNEENATITEQIDVAPVWSVHLAGPPELITRDGRQYVAYFDHDRFLTLAMRDLDSNQWQYHQFSVQMGWETGSHAKLSLAIDRQGYIHITAYRRNMLQEPPMPPRPIYYRSMAPHSVNEFEQLYLVSAMGAWRCKPRQTGTRTVARTYYAKGLQNQQCGVRKTLISYSI